MTFVARLLKFANYVLFRAILPYQAEIQKDIVLEHYGLGVVVHPNVTLGHRVRIFQHASLASRTFVGSPHRIVVGDDVVIGANAVVLSPLECNIYIGTGAQVGAGAVVTKDVAAGDTVIGAPALPIREHIRRERILEECEKASQEPPHIEQYSQEIEVGAGGGAQWRE